MKTICGFFTCLCNLVLLAELCALPEMHSGFPQSSLSVGSSSYVRFSGDITLNYTLENSNLMMDDDLHLQLLNDLDGSTMSSLPLPSNSSSGEVEFPCAEIKPAPSIFFRITDTTSGSVLAVSGRVLVVWPSITIRTSTRRYEFLALTENIAVDVVINDWERLTCPWNDSVSTYQLSLEFYKSEDSSVPDTAVRTVHTINIHQLFDRREHSVTFPCRIIDEAGRYRVVLRAQLPPKSSAIIAESDYLTVDWNADSYELRSAVSAVYPCVDDLVVFISRPRCAAGDDKVRLYRREENITVASASKLFYMAERRARKSSNQVEFPCSIFEDSLAPVYCWKYVSSARSGAVHEHTTLCLPATALDRPIDGRWSAWSDWSPCSVTCLSGTQVRFRSCDNPPPANGGAFCDGPMTEYQPCDVICRDTSFITTVNYNLMFLNNTCECGCRLTESSGTVVVTAGCPSVAQWIIAVNIGETIRLTFPFFDLESEGQANLKVRDGETPMSNLLLNSYGVGRPRDIVSSGNVLMMEFRSPVNFTGGFVATYSIQTPNQSGVENNSKMASSESLPLWKSIVIIVGVAVCCGIILVAVIVVCCNVTANRRRRNQTVARSKNKRTKAEKIATERRKKDTGRRTETTTGTETSRVYPIGRDDDITPSKFLATSSPYLDVHSRLVENTRQSGRPHLVPLRSSRNTAAVLIAGPNYQEECIDAISPVGIPIDFPPTTTATAPYPLNLKPRKRTRNENSPGRPSRHRRHSGSRDRKKQHNVPPPPTSTFEEDLLMLARQNEVTESGVASSRTSDLVDAVPGRNIEGVSPDHRRNKSNRRKRDSKSDLRKSLEEATPLRTYADKESKRKSRNQSHRSTLQRTTNEDRGVEKPRGIYVGQRPPVEGSVDSKLDPSYGIPLASLKPLSTTHKNEDCTVAMGRTGVSHPTSFTNSFKPNDPRVSSPGYKDGNVLYAPEGSCTDPQEGGSMKFSAQERRYLEPDGQHQQVFNNSLNRTDSPS